MILPPHADCVRILEELQDEPHLSLWETDFIESNLERTHFTDKQREAIANLRDKYDV